MQSLSEIHLSDVQAVYSGPEGRLWELLMGEQIHIGGFQSSMDLAQRADMSGIQEWLSFYLLISCSQFQVSTVAK